MKKEKDREYPVSLELSQEESEVFGNIVKKEIDELASEYSRCIKEGLPEKGHEKLHLLNMVYKRWLDAQDTLTTRKHEKLVLFPAKPCDVSLSEEEYEAVSGLLKRYMEELECFPYMKEKIKAARSIAEKLHCEFLIFEWYLTDSDFYTYKEVSEEEEERILGDVIVRKPEKDYIVDIHYGNCEEHKGFDLDVYKMYDAGNRGEWLGSIKDVKPEESADMFRRHAEKLIVDFLDTAPKDPSKKEKTDWLILARTDEDDFKYSFSKFSGTEEEVSSYLLDKRESDMAACKWPRELLNYENVTHKYLGWITTYFTFFDGYIDYYAVPITPGSEWVMVSYVGGVNRYDFRFMPKSAKSRVRTSIEGMWDITYGSITGDLNVPKANIVQHDTHMSVETSIPHTGTVDIIAFPLTVLDQKEDLIVECLAEDTNKTDSTDRAECGPESFAEHFPQAGNTLPGQWCENGFVVECENSKVEIGVYREPNNGGEYAGTLTLQIFQGDEVIFCERIVEKTE